MKIDVFEIEIKKGKHKGTKCITFDNPYGFFFSAFDEHGNSYCNLAQRDIKVLGKHEEEMNISEEDEELYRKMKDEELKMNHSGIMTGYEIEELLNKGVKE